MLPNEAESKHKASLFFIYPESQFASSSTGYVCFPFPVHFMFLSCNSLMDKISPTNSHTNAPLGRSSKVRRPHPLPSEVKNTYVPEIY